MSSRPRLIVELSTYFLRAAVAAGERVVAHREFTLDDGAGLASFLADNTAGLPVDLALLAPVSGFAGLAGAEEAATLRTSDALLERAAALGGAGASAAVCDVVNGRIPEAGGGAAWLLAGVPSAAADASARQLAALGLAPAATVPALPAELGAVVELLRAAPEPGRVVVWVPGESAGGLWLVSPEGLRSVRAVAAGYAQIFEAVQAELGLKFRGAAAKLFFNDGYDFGEAADRIGGRLGEVLRGALEGETPAALHVLGLPAGQVWLSRAMANSLGMSEWAPAPATVTGRYGVATELASPRAAGLLQAVAAGRAGGEWLPAWLAPGAVIPAVAVPAPAPIPAPTPAPVAEAQPVAAIPPPAPTPAPAKAVVPKPVAVPAVSVVRPAVAQPAAKPVPAAAPRKFPVVPVLAGVAVVGLLVGGALFFLKSGTPSPAPSPAAKPLAVPVATVPAAPAIASSVQLALLESEVKRDPSGFKGDRYQFSVSNKGVLTGFQETGRMTPWIRNLGFMRLYGVTMQPDGRRAVRRAGDMNSPDYRAKVTKRVRDGAVVFDVVVAHPKFTLNQTFVCLPRSLKVEARFKPVSLADQSGPLDAVYGVHLETAEFVSPNAQPLMRTGEVVYATKQGSLILRYDPSFTGAGSQPVVGDPALTSFVLAVAGGTKEQVLNYEIILP